MEETIYRVSYRDHDSVEREERYEEYEERARAVASNLEQNPYVFSIELEEVLIDMPQTVEDLITFLNGDSFVVRSTQLVL